MVYYSQYYLEFTINSLWGYSESTESNFKTYASGVQNSTGGPKFWVENGPGEKMVPRTDFWWDQFSGDSPAPATALSE